MFCYGGLEGFSIGNLSFNKSPDSLELAKSTVIFPFAKGESFPPDSFVKGFFCMDIADSSSDYYFNSLKYYWIKGVVEGYMVISHVEFRVGLWIMRIGVEPVI